ncbi:hypothetical protein CDD80_2120 [Ophiocordyceps camponoti-rufipedis]|uniref:Chromo domain-containing protein n=1 Tax=Ophiocordyceps camponoti-rufipedis TaxID=2004952 RepID=A0A2C5ZGQ5_9HYPO|nr:hypothetical protein CDD80_2120 [Ophiocordyceps camponoti-rufipedis]
MDDPDVSMSDAGSEKMDTASSVASVDSADEFSFNQILAERMLDGVPMFLVEWENYDLNEATWEPARHLHQDTIDGWEDFKTKTGRRSQPGFKVSTWKEAVLAKAKEIERDNDRRHLAGKRLRQNNPAITLESYALIEEFEDSDEESLFVPSSEFQQARDSQSSLFDSLFDDDEDMGEAATMIPDSGLAPSTDRDINVFVGGKQRKERLKLLDVVSDTSKTPKLLKMRHQNIVQKGLRDREGVVAPALNPGQLMPLSKDAAVVQSNPPALETEGSADASTNLTGAEGTIEKRKRKVHWDDNHRIHVIPRLGEEPFGMGQNDISADIDDLGGKLHLMEVQEGAQLRNRQSHLITGQFGPNGESTSSLTFHGLPGDTTASWLKHLKSQNRIVFTHTCTFQDWSAWPDLVEKELCEGTVSGFVDAVKLRSIADWLETGCSCSMHHNPQYSIVLFPLSDGERWTSSDGETHMLKYTIVKPSYFFDASALTPLYLPPTPNELEVSATSGVPIFDTVFGPGVDEVLSWKSQESGQTSVFLAFPASARQEANFIVEWLRYRKPDCLVKSGLHPGEWLSFLKLEHGVVKLQQGTVIIHEDAIWAIRSFPHFAQLLHRPSDEINFHIFKRALQKLHPPPTPIILPSPTLNEPTTNWRPSGEALQQVFRLGDAFLLTPSFFVSQPEQACNLMECLWDNKKRLLSNYFRKSPVVLAPASIGGDDEQSLVNWFAWWAISKMDLVRRFYVVGSEQRLTRVVRLLSASDYVYSKAPDTKAQDRPSENRREPLKMIRNDKAPTIRDFLQSVVEAIKRETFRPMALFFVPITSWNPSTWIMSSGDLHNTASYFQWETFLKKRPIKCNTFSAFFYTSDSALDAPDPRHDEGKIKRRAWIAIIRASNPHMLKWSKAMGMELFIWDIVAWNRHAASKEIYENDLIQAQKTLIEVFNCQSVPIFGLPLEQVWLGGAPAVHGGEGLTQPLDAALYWLQQLSVTIKDILPAPKCKLPERGWRPVTPGGPPGGPPAPGPEPGNLPSAVPDGTIASPGGTEPEAAASTSVKTRLAVFLPPGSDGTVLTHRNSLYDWAEGERRRGVHGKTEFVFEPTMKWYGAQVQRGQGLHHLDFVSWRTVVQSLKGADL